MLNETILIDGQNAKALEEAIKLYEDAKLQESDFKKIKTDNGNIIKAICNKEAGKYETSNYVVTLTQVSDSIGIDEQKLKALYPDVYEACLTVTRKGSLRLNDITKKSKI